MTAAQIAQAAYDKFMELSKSVPQEVYWEAAEELQSMLEGVIMEKEEQGG